ncbi:circadian clock protein LdpA [Oscillatoria salina]|uniref:circadian clock protein LdpA n=1 Tax=Oscillatoria salina TaxID=331517 RepID=UPI001CCEE810|nr:LdpA C-terminal domain-containing domain [Oscillatoria salina]MBZ8179730.1 4Fe-4S ferredoxin [Oscillatoria salina IIICB1]
MSELYYPLHSLKLGHWFKLICGASFQHLPAVRSLTLAYTLAGADCIDVAADPAAIAAAKEALAVAEKFAEAATARGFGYRSLPWLMVSLNDGEDPHFRKAEFDSTQCPPECSRPCQQICPAEAISDLDRAKFGVIDERCYGCGRCIPVCPEGLIFARSYVYTPEAIAPLILESGIDAIEIHTQVGHEQDFQRIWQAIAPWVDRLKLLAISCPDGANLEDYLHFLYAVISPLPCPLIWQTDGRPMSGDIGKGTTSASIKLAQKVLQTKLPGYIQLAGGTNNHTVTKLAKAGLLNSRERLNFEGETTQSFQSNWGVNLQAKLDFSSHQIAGVAYGSYARSRLAPILDRLEKGDRQTNEANSAYPLPKLENDPNLLWQAVMLAHSLVSQVKSFSANPLPIH